MTLVTLADACLRLPELIALVAKGEQVVIVQNGVTLAALTPPPFAIRTPDEAERQRLVEDLERNIARWHEEDGLPYPPTDLPREQREPESPAA